MKKRIITLGGLPGSGKSTIKRILSETLGYQMLSTGDFVRDMAHDRNLTLEEFNEVIMHDKTLDADIDARLIEIESTGDRYVVDSHLAFHFIPSGFSVFLNISEDRAAERIFHDAQSPNRIKSGETGATLEEVRERTRRRIQNHTDRYQKHYGVAPYNTELYEYVVDTDGRTPEEVATAIVAAYTAWLAPETP